jgi:hypothetical protein
LNQLRVERVAGALARKCPKLTTEKAKGHESVLVLESDDLSLANSDAIGRALEVALANCPEPPDRVYLVETEMRPWRAYLLKDRADVYPNPRLLRMEPTEFP